MICFTIFYAIAYATFKIAGWRIPQITSDIVLTKYDLVPHLLISVSGSIAILGFSYKIGENRILEALGKKSLVIYCLHFPVFFAFYNMFRDSINNMGIHQTLTSLLILHIFSLWLTYNIGRLLETRYLKFIIGKF